MAHVDDPTSIEVFALRYATMRGRKASEVYHRYDLLDLEDRVLDMDCYFWLVRSSAGITLIDCGWDRSVGLHGVSPRYHHIEVDERDPVDLLASVGVTPGDVDRVIISHMHFDHVGNLDLFPGATLVMSRAEYACWSGPESAQPRPPHPVMNRDMQIVEDHRRRGRLHLVDEPCEIVPGITVHPLGGHTPGQVLVEVQAEAGTVLLASDAVHYHEELDENRPFYVFSDLGELIDGYDLLRARASDPATWVVSGHDPVEMERFERVNDHCVNLLRPLTVQDASRDAL
jgi:glyoxylase-like metal-dependent hydrolase (beta-lactamase superfamily II)